MHNKNLFHGDIKPDNILISREFLIKVNDFGTSFFMKDTGNIIKDLSLMYFLPNLSKKYFDQMKKSQLYEFTKEDLVHIDIYSLILTFVEVFNNCRGNNED